MIDRKSSVLGTEYGAFYTSVDNEHTLEELYSQVNAAQGKLEQLEEVVFGSFVRPANSQQAQYQVDLVKEEPKTLSYIRKAVNVVLNGVKCRARPDTGSGQNIITEAFARECGIEYHTGSKDRGSFKLPTGHFGRSIGKALVPFYVPGSDRPVEFTWFYVLEKCSSPLILGMPFIDKFELYTRNKRLLFKHDLSYGKVPMFQWFGSPPGRIDFTANGHLTSGYVDTGSDLDLMSLEYAQSMGYKMDTHPDACSAVLLADETIVETVGKVHISSVQIPGLDDLEMSFHVLPNLVCDVMFGEEFLDQIDAFNTCEIIDGDNPIDIYSFSTLMNLGPIQKLLSRYRKASVMHSKERDHDEIVENEIYVRNKKDRVISKIKAVRRAAAATAVEEQRRRIFDREHLNCIHCGATTATTDSSVEDGGMSRGESEQDNNHQLVELDRAT